MDAWRGRADTGEMSAAPPQQPVDALRFRRRMLAALLLLFVSHATVMLCVLPPFEGWDEYQHVAYIVHLIETGRAPQLGRDSVPESLLRELPSFPASKHAVEQVGPAGVVTYDEWWRRVESGQPPSSSTNSAASAAARSTIPIYQAQHAPFYYRLAAPLFRAAGGTEQLGRAVLTLRIANVALGAAAVFILLRTLFRRCHDPRLAALMGAIVVLNPIFVMNLTRVANDALGVLFATAAVAWTLDMGGRRLPLQAATIGVLCGAAVLGKASNLALLPFATLIVPIQARRSGAGWLACLALALLVPLGAALPTAGYFRDNLRQFGSLFPIQEVVANQRAGHGLAAIWNAARELPWHTLMRDFWGRHMLWRGGWSFLPPSKHWTQAYEYTAEAALLGGLCLLARRRREQSAVFDSPTIAPACAWLWVCYSAALAYHAIQTHIAWNTVATNAWYAAAALPWVVALLVRCAAAWPGRVLKWVPCVNLVWILAYVAYDGVVQRMIPHYTGLPFGGRALERLASLQPPLTGTATLAVAVAGFAASLCAAAMIWGISAWHRLLEARETP